MREERLFHQALDQPADQRDSFLGSACGDDADLRERVEVLLLAHLNPGSFLESPPVATIALPTVTEQPGTLIGRYKLLQQIGEGGFGVVYMAEQTKPVRRKVALKIIKPGMDTKEVIARFEAERQALALMDHPNIAKVFDAGATESGRPYFVMELVKGVPITDYCDKNQLPAQDRLKLFVDVCHAIQHAHQKGVIHRDVKPSNIMVTLHDGKPVPKVIDFGVSKALSQQLTEKTLFTAYGQMIGTPAYMSPEQAELSGLDIDTRADIYSLGVLLYELLTGGTPFDGKRLRSAGYAEMQRIIREEEPPKPSTRLTAMGEDTVVVSDNRGTDPKKLGQFIRGDLDWIVMKALEKDRNRRYETANDFANDVTRFLNDEPVEACPPSAAYRFKKLAQRNKRALSAAAAVALVLILGIVGTSWQAIRATQAESLAQGEAEQARTQAAKANAVVNLLQDMLASANPDTAKGNDYTVRELLDEFSAGLEGHLHHQPEVEATLRQIIGSVYTRLRLPDDAEPHLRRALELRREVFGKDHVKVAETLRQLAWNEQQKGPSGEPETFARHALALYRKHSDPLGAIRTLWILQLHFTHTRRNWSEAERAANDALTLARRFDLDDEPVLANILHALANAKVAQGEYLEAERFAREALEKHLRLHGENHPETGFGWRALGNALQAQKRYDEAEKCFRKAIEIFEQQFPEGYPLLSDTYRSLSKVLKVERDRASLAELAALMNPRSAEDFVMRANLYQELDQYDKALTDLQAAVALKPDDAYVRVGRARLLMALGHEDRALADFEKAIELEPDNARFLNSAAWSFVRYPHTNTQWVEKALTWAQRAVEMAPEKVGVWNTLGVACYRTGNWQDAVNALEKSEELYQHGHLPYNGFFLAMAHWQLGHQDEARQWFDKAVEQIEKKRPKREEVLLRFRTEAEKLMGIEKKETGFSDVGSAVWTGITNH